ncbi:hypothetical protein CMK11_10470 [Candidatus Poribacteria bacterium]|nr:hypothetical protein [Candidatus Poribacteria bacterium]
MNARDTLIRLLTSLRDDVEMCIQNESKDFMLAQPYAAGDGGPSEVADPILLGDFVVDTYNRYLAQAVEATDDAMVRALPTIAPLGAAPVDAAPPQDQSRPRTHGADPRLAKMTEVLMASGQLLAVLQAQESEGENKHADTLETLLTALTSLMEQLDGTRQGHTEDMVREAACPLAERYNAYLDLVVETCDDPIVPRLFTKIDVRGEHADDAKGTRVRAELAASGASLIAYLRRLVGRAEPTSGMRGQVWDGKSKPALAG